MQIMQEIKQLINEIKAENIILSKILVENESIESIPAFLTNHQLKNVIIVYDRNTKIAAGSEVEKELSKGIFHVNSVELKPN